jgi:hypothetical protein
LCCVSDDINVELPTMNALVKMERANTDIYHPIKEFCIALLHGHWPSELRHEPLCHLIDVNIPGRSNAMSFKKDDATLKAKTTLPHCSLIEFRNQLFQYMTHQHGEDGWNKRSLSSVISSDLHSLAAVLWKESGCRIFLQVGQPMFENRREPRNTVFGVVFPMK